MDTKIRPKWTPRHLHPLKRPKKNTNLTRGFKTQPNAPMVANGLLFKATFTVQIDIELPLKRFLSLNNRKTKTLSMLKAKLRVPLAGF